MIDWGFDGQAAAVSQSWAHMLLLVVQTCKDMVAPGSEPRWQRPCSRKSCRRGSCRTAWLPRGQRLHNIQDCACFSFSFSLEYQLAELLRCGRVVACRPSTSSVPCACILCLHLQLPCLALWHQRRPMQADSKRMTWLCTDHSPCRLMPAGGVKTQARQLFRPHTEAGCQADACPRNRAWVCAGQVLG